MGCRSVCNAAFMSCMQVYGELPLVVASQGFEQEFATLIDREYSYLQRCRLGLLCEVYLAIQGSDRCEARGNLCEPVAQGY